MLAGFRADVDLAKLGRRLEALIAVRFRMHQRALVDSFVEYLLSLPETVSLFNVAGDDDYLLHVAVADAPALQTFVIDRLGVRPQVERVRTSLVYKHVRKHPITPAE